jgi:hypothetical protein
VILNDIHAPNECGSPVDDAHFTVVPVIHSLNHATYGNPLCRKTFTAPPTIPGKFMEYL